MLPSLGLAVVDVIGSFAAGDPLGNTSLVKLLGLQVQEKDYIGQMSMGLFANYHHNIFYQIINFEAI